MKIKIFAVILCALTLLGTLTPVAFAEEGDIELTLDVNKRYTDIYEYEEVSDPLLDMNDTDEEKEGKRDAYVAVLLIFLVIAVVILIVTLKRVPKEEDMKLSDNDGAKTTIKILVPKKKSDTDLKDEEKNQ